MMFRSKQLRGKRVGVLAADGFEYVELSVPCKALRKAGAKVEIISLHGGKIRGMNLTEPTRTVCVDRTLEDARPQDYDALLIPGGFIGPDFLRQSRDAREFVKAFDEENKPIATICHGPWLLISAELVSGRSLASWPGVRDDVVHAGGIWRDEAVVRDRNWVSSRGPQDMKEFVPAMLELYAADGQLSAGDVSKQNGSSSRASSPQANRPMGAAVAAARLVPGHAFRNVVVAAAIIGMGLLAIRQSKA